MSSKKKKKKKEKDKLKDEIKNAVIPWAAQAAGAGNVPKGVERLTKRHD